MNPTKKQATNFVQISEKVRPRPWKFVRGRKYEPHTESQNSPRPKNARQAKNKVKSMLIIFFDIMGLIVHKEFVLAVDEQSVPQNIVTFYGD
jgi:hypothetical protein